MLCKVHCYCTIRNNKPSFSEKHICKFYIKNLSGLIVKFSCKIDKTLLTQNLIKFSCHLLKCK